MNNNSFYPQIAGDIVIKINNSNGVSSHNNITIEVNNQKITLMSPEENIIKIEAATENDTLKKHTESLKHGISLGFGLGAGFGLCFLIAHKICC